MWNIEISYIGNETKQNKEKSRPKYCISYLTRAKFNFVSLTILKGTGVKEQGRLAAPL